MRLHFIIRHKWKFTTLVIESYVIVLVIRLCRFLRNRILKNCIIVAYTARDPCAMSCHTIHTVHLHVWSQMYALMIPVSLFSVVTVSERFPMPVEGSSSKLWVSYGIFNLVRRYLLLNKLVLVSELPWKRMLLLQKWLVTQATAMAGRESTTPPSLTKTGQRLGGMLQRTAMWVRYSTV